MTKRRDYSRFSLVISNSPGFIVVVKSEQRKLSLVDRNTICLIAYMHNRLYTDMFLHSPWIITWSSDVFAFKIISIIAHSTWAVDTNSGHARTWRQ